MSEEIKKSIKAFIDANIWDGEDRHSAKNDRVTFTPADLQELIDDVVDHFFPRWIPCGERLPERNTTVIVDGGVAQYGKDGWRSLTGIEYPGKPIQWNVTRWMPLPPTEGE